MTSHLSAAPTSLLDGLGQHELFWRKHYNWLKENGYQLRPRYAPDWIPTWKRSRKSRLRCEDGPVLVYPQVNDAIHIPTGMHVALKKVYLKNHPFEEEIMRYLGSETLSKDPKNHCVRLIDVLTLPREEDADVIQIFVMPWLRAFNSPNFDTFGEAVDCIRQLFEGLQFMHENRVAHRDLKSNNYMLEPEKMFPNGYHPTRELRKPDLSGPAKYFTRTQRPSRYVIIDFGMSRKYEPGNDDPLEPTIVGDDVKLQNPFQVDVYLAGELLREEFLDGHARLEDIRGYRGFEWLRPLVSDMMQDDATKRPKMEEVMKRFNDIVAGFGTWKLRSRTSSRAANVFVNFSRSVSHWRRKVIYIIKRTPSIPNS